MPMEMGTPMEMATSKEMGMSREMGMAKEMGRGGHLYMQTNETRNAVIHFNWSANGTLTEVERIPTGGAGTGDLSPIYHINRPNNFEGAGSVILTPDRRFLFATNASDNSVSSFALSDEGRLTLLDVKRSRTTKNGGAKRLPEALPRNR